MTDDPRTDIELEPIDDPARIAADWDAVARASGNVFATREFLDLWRQRLTGHQKLLVTSCRDTSTGQTVGILPLYRWRRQPLSVVRFLGHGAGDVLGPICAPADAERIARLLPLALEPEAPRLFVGERLPAATGRAIPGARRVAAEGNPTITLAGLDWDGYLSTRSANFRQQLRRKERRLEQQFGLRYRALAPNRFEQDFEALVRLHAARWGRESSFLAKLEFHRAFARIAHERGWLRLWFAEAADAPVAAWYGFCFAGRMSYFQAGRDPAWQGPSVGLVLLAHTIREAIAEGAEEYRLLRGAEAYKYRFADTDDGLESVVIARGGAAAVAVRAAELARSVRRAARRPA